MINFFELESEVVPIVAIEFIERLLAPVATLRQLSNVVSRFGSRKIQ